MSELDSSGKTFLFLFGFESSGKLRIMLWAFDKIIHKVQSLEQINVNEKYADYGGKSESSNQASEVFVIEGKRVQLKKGFLGCGGHGPSFYREMHER